jgi:hypothetical protein
MAAMRLPRRFSFSLRTLLVLVALLCAWLAWERHVVVERRAARHVLNERGAEIGEAPDGPATVPWVHPLFGDTPIQSLTIPSGDKVAERAAGWFPEAGEWAEVGGPGSIEHFPPHGDFLPMTDDSNARAPPRRTAAPTAAC